MNKYFGSSQQNKNAEKEFYNRQPLEIGGGCFSIYHIKHHQKMLSRSIFFISKMIEEEKKSCIKIFEIGSNGDFSRAVKKAFPDRSFLFVMGDIALKQLLRNGVLAHKVNLDLESLPFKDGAFDLIFIRGTLHHFPAIDNCVRELMRTSSKAVVVTNEPCGDNPVVTFSRLISRFLSTFTEISTTVNETMHRMNIYKSSFYKNGAKKIFFESGDDIFTDNESWNSFKNDIKKNYKILLLLRAHLLWLLAKFFSKYPFGWNTFFIFVER